jgi:hypothetical protein
MIKNGLLLIIPILCVCLMTVSFTGCGRKQAPAVIDLRKIPVKPLRPIVESPRYPSYYQDEFILTVFNALAHRVVVNMISEEPMAIEAGQRTDIPFKKGPDRRKVVLTANVFLKAKLIGTAKREQCVPDLGGRSQTADIWVINRYCRLKR